MAKARDEDHVDEVEEVSEEGHIDGVGEGALADEDHADGAVSRTIAGPSAGASKGLTGACQADPDADGQAVLAAADESARAEEEHIDSANEGAP